ncbi:class I SAM-dependent methyltransferase [Paracoccus pacificus]|uniref:Class I SAM-dependent methyltransferase n=1 Tax=Paracoccus pacificus TaxID=1463598 RepID=A0ABW4R835_9RHOB
MNLLLKKFLEGFIYTGDLTVIDHNGHQDRFGDGTGAPVVVRLNTAATELALAIDPELHLGEAYMDGRADILSGDMYGLLKLVFENSGPTVGTKPWMKALAVARKGARRLHQLNTLARSRQNVRRHYDLSADFYRIFLDPDMQYSCAYFPSPGITLDQAQLLKKRHIAAKLLIPEGASVLDIGCGWGGLGVYLARIAGARVTGVTLSEEQLAVAQRRAGDERNPPDFRFQDYRDITGTFDRIVSVGMFEHVGVSHYRTYFNKAAKLLDRDGVMLMHTIGRSDSPAATNPFIRKYIFPGGYLPSLSEIMAAIEPSGLGVTDVEVLRLHYADTLAAWRARFMARRAEAKALYDESFCRMWEFYLAASEAGFRWQNIVVYQVQLSHRQNAVPLTRDYIVPEEARLAQAERDRGLPGPAWPDSQQPAARSLSA